MKKSELIEMNNILAAQDIDAVGSFCPADDIDADDELTFATKAGAVYPVVVQLGLDYSFVSVIGYNNAGSLNHVTPLPSHNSPVAPGLMLELVAALRYNPAPVPAVIAP